MDGFVVFVITGSLFNMFLRQKLPTANKIGNALKQRVSQTEEKLKQTDQKLDNNEVDKEVQKEISEKKQKVIVAEKDVIPEKKWKLENFEMPLRLSPRRL